MFIFLCLFVVVTATTTTTTTTTTTSSNGIDLLALPSANVTSFYSSSSNHYFGCSVHDAGDVNGDDIDDIIIGAPQSTNAGTGPAGNAYVIYGNKNGIPNISLGSLTAAQGFTITGPISGDSTGWSVSKAGDINGDGIGDIIIGAGFSPPSSSGVVYVIFGTKIPRASLIIDQSTLQTLGLGFVIYGSTGNYLGNSVSYAGDVNDDGFEDIIIGGYQTNAGATIAAGKAYIIFGKNAAITPMSDILIVSLSPALGITLQGDTASELLGSSVSSAGDFNGDGVSDIIIGASASGSPGAAYVLFGRSGITGITLPSGLTSTAGFKIQGIMNNDYLGWSVSAADFNGDGFSDVIVGCPQSDLMNSGVAYVIFGKSGAGININVVSTSLSSNGLGFTIFSSNIGNKLGFAVSTVGDFNADGIDDIALTTLYSGATGGSSFATGYVIFGSKSSGSDVDVTSLSSSQGFTISNIQVISYMMFQMPISYAGDVNGDGGQDIVVGSATDVSFPSVAGSAFVIYGIAPPKSTASTNPLQVIVDTENFGTAVGRIVAMAASLFNSASVIPLWFIFLEQILQYPKYLLIDYPPRLENIYDDSQFQLFTIPDISEIPDELNEKITEYSLPGKFEEYGFGSSFLVNFWNPLMTLLIIIAVIVIAIVVDHCTVSSQSLHPFFNKIKYRLKWNYIISMLTGMFCDIALFTSFEFRTLHFDSAFEWISFLLCILVNLAIIVVSIRIVFIIKKFAKRKDLSSRNRHRTRVIKTSQDEFKSYEVVFEGFKNQTLKQQSFFLLFSLRFYLFYMIIGYLFEHTLAQAILVNLIGISSLIFLGLVRPFAERLDFIVSLTQEGALQIIHICVFLFALDDQVNFASEGFRVVLGDIIIGCNSVFMGVSVIYSFILALVLLKGFYSWISKKWGKQNKTKPTNQSPVSSERKRSRAPAPNENKTELDRVNESQIYLNRQPTVEQEPPNRRTNTNKRKKDLNVLDTSILDANTSQIASSETTEYENTLKMINPRREERKRVEMEEAAAEYQRKQNRLNQLKRRK